MGGSAVQTTTGATTGATFVTNFAVILGTATKANDSVLVEIDGFYLNPYYANNIAYTINSTISSTANTVQLAMDTLASKVAYTSGTTFTGSVYGLTPLTANNGTELATTAFVNNKANSGVTFTHSITGNAGTVTKGFYNDSSFYLGTTSISVNRSSGAQTLNGINIDGSASSATTAGNISNAGTVAMESGSNEPAGLTLRSIYNQTGYPTTYGNAISLGGTGGGQLLVGWSGSTGAHADNYIRSRRDTGGTWSGWAKILTDQNIGSVTAPSATSAAYAGYLSNSYAYTNGTDGWFRSKGNAGWYNADYAGGIYMTDPTWVRTYNGTSFYCDGASGIAAKYDITAYYSDERLKDKKGNITGALDAVSKLNGFRYTNNKLANEFGYTADNVQIGLSAQEVEAVFPEIVTLAPFDMKTEDGQIVSQSGENYKTLNYAKLVPVLVEAIKELKAEIEELKGQIK